MTNEERFWSKVEKLDGENACWIWTGQTNSDGYGIAHWFGKRANANRVALEIKLGREIRPGMLSLHTCDNPPCVRPDHLYEGTHGDNGRDKRERGRATTGETARRGANHYLAKLSPKRIARAKTLRQAGWSEYAIAKKFCVSRSTIQQLFDGRSWDGMGKVCGIDARRKLTSEQRAGVFEMQATGLTHDAIAQAFRVSRAAITKIVGHEGIPRGEVHYAAKLKAEQIIEIRLLRKLYAVTDNELAANFGVTRECVGRVLQGRTWKHVA